MISQQTRQDVRALHGIGRRGRAICLAIGRGGCRTSTRPARSGRAVVGNGARWATASWWTRNRVGLPRGTNATVSSLDDLEPLLCRRLSGQCLDLSQRKLVWISIRSRTPAAARRAVQMVSEPTLADVRRAALSRLPIDELIRLLSARTDETNNLGSFDLGCSYELRRLTWRFTSLASAFGLHPHERANWPARYMGTPARPQESSGAARRHAAATARLRLLPSHRRAL